jgi:ParB/RepB/Spo0J family partition protein
MKTALVQFAVPLSRLVPSRRNPRKVKPSRAAHQRLVALVRAQGLLQPLVVRPLAGKRFEVVAGDRRLRALREIHKDNGDPKVPCVLRDVDAATADAMSLGENFAREPMHPLDEADAFAKLATSEGKDARAIAAEFGVPEHYVRQRMKLPSQCSALCIHSSTFHGQSTIQAASSAPMPAAEMSRSLSAKDCLRVPRRPAPRARSRLSAYSSIQSAHRKTLTIITGRRHRWHL